MASFLKHAGESLENTWLNVRLACLGPMAKNAPGIAHAIIDTLLTANRRNSIAIDTITAAATAPNVLIPMAENAPKATYEMVRVLLIANKGNSVAIDTITAAATAPNVLTPMAEKDARKPYWMVNALLTANKGNSVAIDTITTAAMNSNFLIQMAKNTAWATRYMVHDLMTANKEKSEVCENIVKKVSQTKMVWNHLIADSEGEKWGKDFLGHFTPESESPTKPNTSMAPTAKSLENGGHGACGNSFKNAKGPTAANSNTSGSAATSSTEEQAKIRPLENLVGTSAVPSQDI